MERFSLSFRKQDNSNGKYFIYVTIATVLYYITIAMVSALFM